MANIKDDKPQPATEGDAEKANAENRTHCQKKGREIFHKNQPKDL